MRSSAAINSVAISIGAASTIRIEVANTDHTKIGSRDQVIPGARIVMIVAIMFRPSSAIEIADQGEEDDVGVHAHHGLVVERLVAGPAGREAAEEDRRDEDEPGRHQQPERERLDPREAPSAARRS